jgi:hypothetical protein
MWVVVAKKGLDVHRDELIADLLGEEKSETPEYYLVKTSSSYRYNIGSSLSIAKIYKQKSSGERMVRRFNSALKDANRSPFYWIKEYRLSVRKVTFEEWDRMCNEEQNKLDRNYNHQKQKIEQKRSSFK